MFCYYDYKMLLFSDINIYAPPQKFTNLLRCSWYWDSHRVRGVTEINTLAQLLQDY